jgi:hypothetical protein
MHPALKELLFGFTLEHTNMKGQSPLLRQPWKKQSEAWAVRTRFACSNA